MGTHTGTGTFVGRAHDAGTTGPTGTCEKTFLDESGDLNGALVLAPAALPVEEHERLVVLLVKRPEEVVRTQQAAGVPLGMHEDSVFDWSDPEVTVGVPAHRAGRTL